MVHKQKSQYCLSKDTISESFYIFGHPPEYADVPKLPLELTSLTGD